MEKVLVNGTISLDDESYIQVIRKTVRSRKANAVKRQQRFTMQYIEAVEQGIFLLKNKPSIFKML